MYTNNTATSPPCGVGILGATGYAGTELIRLLLDHPRVHLLALSGRQGAGQRASDVIPSLPQLTLTLDDDASDIAAWHARGVQVIFSCLPHGVLAGRAQALLDAGMRLIDLSGDFRLRRPEAYPTHYQFVHPAPQLLDAAVYGLTEWCDQDLTCVRLVSNPGCYATAALLALLPVAQAGLISAAPVVIHAMSGVSGAGRRAQLVTQFAECGGSVAPYKVGDQHAHLGEMGQMLAAAHVAAPLVFNPHLVPMARGILASVAVSLQTPLTADAAQELYVKAYAARPFVRVLDAGRLPETRFVRGSNRCDLAVRLVAQGSLLLIFSAIDNLLKGAAGQAVQNLNRLHGWDDALGLPIGGIACM